MDAIFSFSGNAPEGMKKESSKGLEIYGFRRGGSILTGITASRARHIAEAAEIGSIHALNSERLGRIDAEFILATEAAGKKGIFLSKPWDTSPLNGTVAKNWKEATIDELMEMKAKDSGIVFVDQAFPVKGVGNVILGFSFAEISVHEEWFVNIPGGTARKILVRSLQKHSKNTTAAKPGSRIGASIRGKCEEKAILSREPLLYANKFRIEPNAFSTKIPRQITISVGTISSPASISGKTAELKYPLPAIEGIAYSNDTAPWITGRAVPL